MNNIEVSNPEASCACRTIPLTHLHLDVAEPIIGWEAFFAARAVEVTVDDVGRPSIPREVLGELLAEQRTREERLAKELAENLAADPVPAGVPAQEGSSPFESMAAGEGFTTVADEFGSPRPNFLEEALAEGQQAARDLEAEAKAVKRARRVLDGRDK